MNTPYKNLWGLDWGCFSTLSGALLVAPFEGKENKAYQDPIGIYTICFGWD